MDKQKVTTCLIETAQAHGGKLPFNDLERIIQAFGVESDVEKIDEILNICEHEGISIIDEEAPLEDTGESVEDDLFAEEITLEQEDFFDSAESFETDSLFEDEDEIEDDTCIYFNKDEKHLSKIFNALIDKSRENFETLRRSDLNAAYRNLWRDEIEKIIQALEYEGVSFFEDEAENYYDTYEVISVNEPFDEDLSEVIEDNDPLSILIEKERDEEYYR